MTEDTKRKKFTVDEVFYKTRLEPKIETLFSPVSMIHFVFSLPFQFPVKNGTLFYLIYNNNAYFFHLDKFPDDSKEPMFEEDPGINIGKLRTRVEATIVSKEDFSTRDAQDIYSHFVHSLNKLNGFINAYRIHFEDWKTRPATPENLHSVIWHRIIKVEGWNVVTDRPVLVNPNYTNIITNLSNHLTEMVQDYGA